MAARRSIRLQKKRVRETSTTDSPLPAASTATATELIHTVEESQRMFLRLLFSHAAYPRLCNLALIDGVLCVKEVVLWIMATLRENRMVSLAGIQWAAMDDLKVFSAFFAWACSGTDTCNKFKLEVSLLVALNVFLRESPKLYPMRTSCSVSSKPAAQCSKRSH
jgi:hypothetical protein